LLLIIVVGVGVALDHSNQQKLVGEGIILDDNYLIHSYSRGWIAHHRIHKFLVVEEGGGGGVEIKIDHIYQFIILGLITLAHIVKFIVGGKGGGGNTCSH